LQTRSIYRVVEFALGIEGYPFQHEWLFYVFEATPIFLALAILAFYHPVKLVQKSRMAASGDGIDGGKLEASPPGSLSTHAVKS